MNLKVCYFEKNTNFFYKDEVLYDLEDNILIVTTFNKEDKTLSNSKRFDLSKLRPKSVYFLSIDENFKDIFIKPLDKSDNLMILLNSLRPLNSSYPMISRGNISTPLIYIITPENINIQPINSKSLSKFSISIIGKYSMFSFSFLFILTTRFII